LTAVQKHVRITYSTIQTHVIGTNAMKAVILLLLAGLITTEKASCLTITSSRSLIEGDWKESWYSEPADALYSAAGSFGSSSSSVAGAAAQHSSEPWNFSYARALTSSFFLSMEASSRPYGLAEGSITCLPDTGIRILAGTQTFFQPDGHTLLMTVRGDSHWNYFQSEQEMRLMLHDLSTSTLLVDLQNLDDLRSFDFTVALDVDPSHKYELSLVGWITAWDGKYTDMSSTVSFNENISRVTESGHAAGFLAVGLLAVGFFGRAVRAQCFP
jgi:hypothetical protein